MRYDTFVHVDYPIGEMEGNMAFYAIPDYFTGISIIARSTKAPIRICLPSGDSLKTIIPAERSFIGYSSANTRPQVISNTGFVDTLDEQRYRKIYKGATPEDEFVIHGAYYGVCTTHQAIQIASLILSGRFLHPRDPDFLDQVARIEEDIERINIRFGIVYKGMEPLEEKLQALATRLERKGETQIF